MSSALNEETSNSAPRDFMMSSSMLPDVVTKMFGIFNEQSCAKRPRRPDVTMLDVKVRNILQFSLFIFRKIFVASCSSIDWYPRDPKLSTSSVTVMSGLYWKSFIFFILR